MFSGQILTSRANEVGQIFKTKNYNIFGHRFTLKRNEMGQKNFFKTTFFLGSQAPQSQKCARSTYDNFGMQYDNLWYTCAFVILNYDMSRDISRYIT